MDYRTRLVGWSLLLAVLALVSALAVRAAYARESIILTGEAATMPQDVTRIESRLSQLEQRFYSMEVSIRRLEQQSRLSGITAGRTGPDMEVGLLRTEVEALRRRLVEVECGLVRLDERTLNVAAREARRRADVGVGDPCRNNANVPLRMSSRP